MRGEIYELPRPRNATGREQQGNRYCVVVQNSNLPLSTWVICPTSTQARPASWRAEIEIDDTKTLVLTEQVTAVDPERLGKLVGYVTASEMQAINRGLRIALDLP